MGMAAYTGATTGGSPDHDQILSHFETWFGDCTQGQIDIGWMDPVTGRLNHFKRFGAGDFDPAQASGVTSMTTARRPTPRTSTQCVSQPQ